MGGAQARLSFPFFPEATALSSCGALRVTFVCGWLLVLSAAQSPLFCYQLAKHLHSLLIKCLQPVISCNHWDQVSFSTVYVILKEKLDSHDWHSTKEQRTFISTKRGSMRNNWTGKEAMIPVASSKIWSKQSLGGMHLMQSQPWKAVFPLTKI